MAHPYHMAQNTGLRLKDSAAKASDGSPAQTIKPNTLGSLLVRDYPTPRLTHATRMAAPGQESK